MANLNSGLAQGGHSPSTNIAQWTHGIQCIPGLPIAEALANLGTWPLHPVLDADIDASSSFSKPQSTTGRKVTVSYWRARTALEDSTDGTSTVEGIISSQQRVNLNTAVEQLQTMRFAEACILAALERSEEAKRNGRSEGQRHGKGEAEDAQPYTESQTEKHADVESGKTAFARQFLQDRLLFAVQEDEQPEDEVHHQHVLRHAQGMYSNTLPTGAKRQAKRRRTDTNSGTRGQTQPRTQSLWLFRVCFYDSTEGAAVPPASASLSFCDAVLRLSSTLPDQADPTNFSHTPTSAKQRQRPLSQLLSPSEQFQLSALEKACAALQHELPLLMLETEKPDHTITLEELRNDALVCDALQRALHGAFVAWALHRQHHPCKPLDPSGALGAQRNQAAGDGLDVDNRGDTGEEDVYPVRWRDGILLRPRFRPPLRWPRHSTYDDQEERDCNIGRSRTGHLRSTSHVGITHAHAEASSSINLRAFISPFILQLHLSRQPQDTAWNLFPLSVRSPREDRDPAVTCAWDGEWDPGPCLASDRVPRSGATLLLAPLGVQATFVDRWMKADINLLQRDAARDHAVGVSTLHAWESMKEELKTRLLAMGCLSSPEVEEDLERDRYILCKRQESENENENENEKDGGGAAGAQGQVQQGENDTSTGNTRVFLWLQSLCYLAVPRHVGTEGSHVEGIISAGEKTKTASVIVPAVERLNFATPQRLGEVLDNSRKALQRLASARTKTRQEAAPPITPPPPPAQLSIVDAQGGAQVALTATALKGVALKQEPSMQSAVEEQPQEWRLSHAATAEDAWSSSEGDADLWGEADGEDGRDVSHSSSDRQGIVVDSPNLKCTSPTGNQAELLPPAAHIDSVEAFGSDHPNPAFGVEASSAPAKRAFEDMDIVTDVDFDFFGGGGIVLADLPADTNVAAKQGQLHAYDAPAPNAALEGHASSGPPHSTSLAAPLLVLQQIFPRHPAGAVTGTTFASLDAPSLPAFTPGSLTASSPTMGPLLGKTPQTPGDEQHFVPDSVAIANFDNVRSSVQQSADEDLSAKSVDYDLDYHLLGSMRAMMPRDLPTGDMASKYEEGKFAVPVDGSTSTQAKPNGDAPDLTVQLQAQTQTRLQASTKAQAQGNPHLQGQAPPRKKRLLATLRHRHMNDEELSELGTADASVSGQSDSDDSDSESEADRGHAVDEVQTLKSQLDLLSHAVKIVVGRVSVHSRTRALTVRGRQTSSDAQVEDRLYNPSCTRLLHYGARVQGDAQVQSMGDECEGCDVAARAIKDPKAFAAGSISRVGTLQLLEQTQMIVSSAGSVLKINAAAVPFWSKLNLAPVAGRKNVTCLLLVEESSEGFIGDTRRRLDVWKYSYESMSLGTFSQVDVAIIAASDPRTPALSELRMDSERWNNTIHSLGTRVNAAAAHDKYTVLWVAGCKETPDQEILGAIQVDLRLLCRKAGNPQPFVTVVELTAKRPSYLDCLALYDSIESSSPPEATRHLHRELTPSGHSFQSPAFALAPATYRQSKHFSLTWPHVSDSHDATDYLVHVAYDIDFTGSIWTACIDNKAQLSETKQSPKSGKTYDDLLTVWTNAVSFARRASQKCTIVLCHSCSSREEIRLGCFKNIAAEQKPPWIEHVIFLCLDRSTPIALPWERLAPPGHDFPQQANAARDNSLMHDSSRLDLAWTFPPARLIHDLCDVSPLASGLLASRRLCSATASSWSTENYILHILATVPESSAGMEEVMQQVLVSFHELRTVTKLRLACDLPLPWHVAAVRIFAAASAKY
ncbi:hypothetical protein K437DRAFT_254019 [Tilletiaria anomala UBC 951]|uniref:Mediator of RNA polymerase II transcription subunit 13 n=1 Tax=Tilletiaria anomala (strain ATCC 24038 / CBS 436.72 / UBC 951) TaxID=1037660 RepID=A0A066WJ80_TILAU|nr:uncharacterized protein K437DRAFT_254019 [Tilletiaria anomala UBC 951]KDN52618.1 hypothetical protein K437DRAFT_254019 [Tilletiaria anomala UBC 951]